MTMLIVFVTLLGMNACLLVNGLPMNDAPEGKTRFRRGLRSYFYNYLDEMAMSICASHPNALGHIYAVRRTCGSGPKYPSCATICTDPNLKKQAQWASKTAKWSCIESLHVYKKTGVLADNYEAFTDSQKLGLRVYRYGGCGGSFCGPNYCCCKAA